METVRYLGQEENQRTRELYEIAFPEDSREFVDYYYTWKTKENKILVMENEKGVIQVMMHLNPYQIHIHDCQQEIPYIVAVATHPSLPQTGKDEKGDGAGPAGYGGQTDSLYLFTACRCRLLRKPGICIFPLSENSGETKQRGRMELAECEGRGHFEYGRIFQ